MIEGTIFSLERTQVATRAVPAELVAPQSLRMPELNGLGDKQNDSIGPVRDAVAPTLSVAIHALFIGAVALAPFVLPKHIDTPDVHEPTTVVPVQSIAYSVGGPEHPAHALAHKKFAFYKFAGLFFVPNVTLRVPAPPQDVLAGIPDGVSSGRGDILDGVVSALAPVIAPVTETPMSQPIDHLQKPRLLRVVAVIYPELAQRLRLIGDVVVDALIDKSGKVNTVRVISGHPFLVASVVKALSEETFSPTILDGEPIASRLRVEVRFRLNGGTPSTVSAMQ